MLITDKYKKLGISPSVFGMGTMRLPLEKEAEGPFSSKIDKKEAIKMIRYAIDNGVTYIDTAWPYHQGESETVVGEALKDGYRERVTLVTKLPTFLLKEKHEMEEYLDKQLKKLQTDHVDFYLLHTLSRPLWDICKKFDALSFLDKMAEKGKIRFPAFSFHDDYALFEEIINSYNWRMCQIQFNYLDTEYQAGLKGLRLAGSKNIPVVIMEPLKGGMLAKKEISGVKKIYDEYGIEFEPVKASFRYILSYSEVATVLSGVHTMEQLKDNIEIFSSIDRNPLTQKEIEFYNKLQSSIKAKTKIGCTACGYCMPCPSNVKIPDIFDKYNCSSMFDDVKFYSNTYHQMYTTKGTDASNCVECGKCEGECPQHLPIIKTLKEAHNLLAKKIDFVGLFFD